MINSDLARMVLILGLVFVTELWQVYLLLIVKSSFDVIFSPAKNGKITVDSDRSAKAPMRVQAGDDRPEAVVLGAQDLQKAMGTFRYRNAIKVTGAPSYQSHMRWQRPLRRRLDRILDFVA